MTDLERVKKAIDWLIYMGIATTNKDLADKMGYNESSFSQIISGRVGLSPKFVKNLANMDSRLSEEWILTGVGEITKPECGNYNSGNASGNINQNNNTAEGFDKFVQVLSEQTKLTEKSMEQTNTTLKELAEQRKQIDRLINILQEKLS